MNEFFDNYNMGMATTGQAHPAPTVDIAATLEQALHDVERLTTPLFLEDPTIPTSFLQNIRSRLLTLGDHFSSEIRKRNYPAHNGRVKA